MTVAADVDALFGLPLAEFTAARNALAAQLKKSGRETDAARVKALAKPPVSAWTVNQLYWRHRDIFDRFLTAGEQFRRAQAAQLAGKSTNSHDPLSAQRNTLAELSRHAATTLREAGHPPTPDMMRRITITLEALAAHGAAPGAPSPGRLTKDVDPPGFEALAALVPGAGIPPAGTRSNRVLAFRPEKREEKPTLKIDPEKQRRRQEQEQKAQRAAAQAAVREATVTLREARRAAEQTEAALKKAAASAREMEKQKKEAEQRVEKILAAADAAHQNARRVAAEAEGAARAVADAERALQKAAQELERLG